MSEVEQRWVGESDVSAAFRARLEQAGRAPATVLLIGESGSGKSLAASLIHGHSPRAAGPLVTVSLAALAPTLLEAELFGHEEGAFTGAHRARMGRFRQADGGTIVLDDIVALPRDLQGKLLRALQERRIEPLGAETSVPIDVRVLATSQRDPRQDVELGQLRADLYYRLAVLTLEVPPLRARPGDLPLLVDALSSRIAAKLGVARRALSSGAEERLRRHAWPGNVRELENAIERVLVLPAAPGAPIAAEELDFLELTRSGALEELAERALANGVTLADLEHAMLRRALEAARGNVARAARTVGLSRRAFEYRLAREPSHGGESEG
jgi:DNA-binding NtrC family response regulator